MHDGEGAALMGWVRLDDGFPEHPKVSDLPDNAFRAAIEGNCFSARSGRDGGIPSSIAHRLWTRRSIAELVSRGIWHEGHGCGSETCIHGTGDGYVVHDFLDYNPSSAERKAKSSAGSNAARSRWSKGESEESALGVGDGVGVGVSKIKESPEFVEFYERTYPRREHRGPARKAWLKAVTKATAEQIIQGAARFAADPNREAAYTPHPASWLNAEAWSDDALPTRNGHKRSPDRTALALRRLQGKDR